MSIATTVRTAGPFAGTGSLVALPFAFKVFTASDLVVQRTNVAGDVATLTLTTHYSVSLNSDQDTAPGGTVTLVTALAVGETAALTSSVSATQPLQLASGGPFLPGQIEDALDRAMIVVQQQGVLGEQTLRVPLGETALILPSADQRANKALLFDADGDPYLAAPVSGSAADVMLQYASTASGKGASLVGVEDAGGWFSAVITKTGESVLGWVGRWIGGQPINVFEYMTVAEIASVKAYNFSADVTTAVQAAMDAAWTQKRDLYCPGGGYNVTGLTLPGTYPTLDERDQAFRMSGQGYGNPFSALNGGGTVFRSTTNAPVFADRAIASANAHGTLELSHMRIDGNTTQPIVKLTGFYGTSSIHNVVIYQRGVGDGLYIGYGATGIVRECYVINKDFATLGLGAARVGTGINFPATWDVGLVTFTKCTSRGFLNGYVLGGVGSSKAYTATIRDCECSAVYNGITITSKAEYCNIEDNYMEGIEGVGISDSGNFTKIVGNNMFSGFDVGISLASTAYGGVCANNTISTSTKPNVTCILVGTGAGLGKTVTNNTIVWASSGGSIAGVSGITVTGANAQINLSGNVFSPKINWVGGAGSQQITDNTTSTLSAGSGQYGLGTASFDNLQVPMLNQGAISLARAPTAITSVASGVCSLSAASSHVITFAGATNITSFTAPNLEGKLFKVRVTNGNCTFVNGASLKMNGGANYTPGANGASIEFLVHSNVAWEQSRTPY